MGNENIVWIGPGVTEVGGKTKRPGDRIIKKEVPSATWENWIKKGKIGSATAKSENIVDPAPDISGKKLQEQAVKITALEKELEKITAEKEELLPDNNKALVKAREKIEELRGEKAGLEQEIKLLKQTSGGRR